LIISNIDNCKNNKYVFHVYVKWFTRFVNIVYRDRGLYAIIALMQNRKSLPNMWLQAFLCFFYELRTNIKINTDNFNDIFTCTCEIIHGRGNRTYKPKQQSPKPYYRAIRKFQVYKITN